MLSHVPGFRLLVVAYRTTVVEATDMLLVVFLEGLAQVGRFPETMRVRSKSALVKKVDARHEWGRRRPRATVTDSGVGATGAAREGVSTGEGVCRNVRGAVRQFGGPLPFVVP